MEKVTVEVLDVSLRMVGLSFDKRTITKIIDLVEMIQEKGDEASIKDVSILEAKWLNNNK